MTQGTGGPGDDFSKGWPSYPSGPDFVFPESAQPHEQGSDATPPPAPNATHPPVPNATHPPVPNATHPHAPNATHPHTPNATHPHGQAPGSHPGAAPWSGYSPAPGGVPSPRPGPAYPIKKSNGPAIAVIVALGVLVLVGVLGVAAWLLVAPRQVISDPPGIAATRAPESASAQPSSPISPAPPGQPAQGELKERLDRQYGTFETIRRTGTGPATIELPAEARRGVLWAKTDGAGWFSVKLVDERGQSASTFYSGDPEEGTVGYGLRARSNAPVRVTVEAREAAWELELRPVSSVPVFTGDATGTGMSVLVTDGPQQTVQLDYQGEANFIVVQYGAERTRHHANEIGDSSVTATLDEGLTVLEIEAWRGGDWAVRAR